MCKSDGMNKDLKYWLSIIGGLITPVILLVLFLILIFIVLMIVPVCIWLFWNIIIAPVFNVGEITILQAIVIFVVMWLINLMIGGNSCRRP